MKPPSPPLEILLSRNIAWWFSDMKGATVSLFLLNVHVSLSIITHFYGHIALDLIIIASSSCPTARYMPDSGFLAFPCQVPWDAWLPKGRGETTGSDKPCQRKHYVGYVLVCSSSFCLFLLLVHQNDGCGRRRVSVWEFLKSAEEAFTKLFFIFLFTLSARHPFTVLLYLPNGVCKATVQIELGHMLYHPILC